MLGQNTHQNEVEDYKSGKIYHLGELSDNLRTWLLLFHTHFPGHESQNLEFCLRPNFGQDHPPLVENVLVAIFFIKKPLQGKSLVEIDFKWQSHRDQSNAIFHLSLRHKGDLCPQGGEVFRGSWMRGEIGKLFITPFISTSQTKRRGFLNVWDAFKIFNLLRNWRVLMYFVLLEILDSKLWLQKTFQLLSAWKRQREPFGQLCNCRVSHKYWECGSVHCGC